MFSENSELVNKLKQRKPRNKEFANIIAIYTLIKDQIDYTRTLHLLSFYIYFVVMQSVT